MHTSFHALSSVEYECYMYSNVAYMQQSVVRKLLSTHRHKLTNVISFSGGQKHCYNNQLTVNEFIAVLTLYPNTFYCLNSFHGDKSPLMLFVGSLILAQIFYNGGLHQIKHLGIWLKFIHLRRQLYKGSYGMDTVAGKTFCAQISS